MSFRLFFLNKFKFSTCYYQHPKIHCHDFLLHSFTHFFGITHPLWNTPLCIPHFFFHQSVGQCFFTKIAIIWSRVPNFSSYWLSISRFSMLQILALFPHEKRREMHLHVRVIIWYCHCRVLQTRPNNCNDNTHPRNKTIHQFIFATKQFLENWKNCIMNTTATANCIW